MPGLVAHIVTATLRDRETRLTSAEADLLGSAMWALSLRSGDRCLELYPVLPLETGT